MSEPLYTLKCGKAGCFYPEYERKADLKDQTHYCPGCGHGITHKLMAEAIDELGIQDRVILVSPVGCSVFLYYYFDVGNVQVAHGRASAVATALKRARPEAIVISYQGDGDLAAIGSAEILHSANRGENITVLFVNNGIYGMTGGQMAPTTPVGAKTTTTPRGRNVWNDGYPLHISEVLSSLEGPSFIERVALGNPKQILQAKKAIRKALEAQIKGLGFSLVEVLSPCPTIWKMDPVEAQRYVREEMTRIYPLGAKRDRLAEAAPRPLPEAPPPLEEIPRLLKIDTRPSPPSARHLEGLEDRIKIAGFGGQGVLLLGQLIAEAGMDDGLEVSWLPSYGPEMRSGTSNCHVRLASKPVDSPLVTRPNILLAMNEPSLRKFLPDVVDGGLVLYNGQHVPEDCHRPGVRVLAMPFAEMADSIGSAKAGNIVMLGALMALHPVLPDDKIDGALKRLVKTERWLELDRAAFACGKNAALELESCHA
jgi:2-oxoisovalerate ferredoxin oxidoreductase beta subunit